MYYMYLWGERSILIFELSNAGFVVIFFVVRRY